MFDTAYISENLPFCPAEAAAIADRWHGRLEEAAKWSHYVRGTDRLWLGPELRRVNADRFGIRQASGILWVHGLPVPVEFELSVWSTGVTTMAIRPRGRVPIVSRPGYHDAAYRAVRDMARSFVETRESVGTGEASYQAVKKILVERTFAWPSPASRETSPSSPGVFDDAETVGKTARVKVGSR